MAKAKEMRKLISYLQLIGKDSRLYPKGRLLVALLYAAYSTTTPAEDQRFLKALIAAQFIRKGSVDFTDDFGLASGGMAPKAPHTKLEESFADNIDQMLTQMLKGENGKRESRDAARDAGSGGASADTDTASSAS